MTDVFRKGGAVLGNERKWFSTIAVCSPRKDTVFEHFSIIATSPGHVLFPPRAPVAKGALRPADPSCDRTFQRLLPAAFLLPWLSPYPERWSPRVSPRHFCQRPQVS